MVPPAPLTIRYLLFNGFQSRSLASRPWHGKRIEEFIILVAGGVDNFV